MSLVFLFFSVLLSSGAGSPHVMMKVSASKLPRITLLMTLGLKV